MRKGDRQTEEGGKKESEADGRQQPGGSLVPHRYDVDFHQFPRARVVFKADLEPRESHPVLGTRVVCS